MFTYSDLGIDCTSFLGNISADLLLVSPGTGDFTPAATSPVIGAGLPPQEFSGVSCTDIDGKQRLLDGDGDGFAHPEMGAIEVPSTDAQVLEVTRVVFDEMGVMSWDDVADRSSVYRDLRSNRSYASLGDCFVSGLFSPSFFDFDDPPDGDGFFYLITGEDQNLEEGTKGAGSCAERSRFVPCP